MYNFGMIKRLIFIDLDGTALDQRKKGEFVISQENIEAIKEIKPYARVIFSTGRANNKKTFELIDPTGIKDLIFWNGAGAIMDDQNQFLWEIEKYDVDIFIDLAKKFKLNFVINSLANNSYYSSRLFHFVAKNFLKHKTKLLKDFDYVGPSYKFFVIGNNRKVIKSVCELVNKSSKSSICVETGNGGKFLEITHKNATKGNAAKYIANKLGVELKNCYHIGDSMNDSTTAGVVGKLIALKNATTGLKNMANEISKYSFRKHGVARILNELKEEFEKAK